MEAALIIIVVAVALLIAGKRFKSLVRNDFYLDKPDISLQSKCRLKDAVHFSEDGKRRKLLVYFKDHLLGEVPEDYERIVRRKLKENQEAEGSIAAINKYGYKIYLEMKGEVGDIVK